MKLQSPRQHQSKRNFSHLPEILTYSNILSHLTHLAEAWNGMNILVVNHRISPCSLNSLRQSQYTLLFSPLFEPQYRGSSLECCPPWQHRRKLPSFFATFSTLHPPPYFRPPPHPHPRLSSLILHCLCRRANHRPRSIFTCFRCRSRYFIRQCRRLGYHPVHLYIVWG